MRKSCYIFTTLVFSSLLAACGIPGNEGNMQQPVVLMDRYLDDSQNLMAEGNAETEAILAGNYAADQRQIDKAKKTADRVVARMSA